MSATSASNLDMRADMSLTQVMNWRQTLEFPPEVPVSETATKTIMRSVAVGEVMGMGWILVL